MRPPKISGGQPLCPKNLFDKVRQFVTPCKKNEQAFQFLLSPILCMEPVTNTNTRHKGWCMMREKNWKPYKPPVAVPLAVARLTGRLVFCDWILQKPEGLKSMWYGRIRNCFCCKLVPSSRTKDIELLWATNWLWRARNMGSGPRSRHCCLFGIIRPVNISGVYVFTEVEQDIITSST